MTSTNRHIKTVKSYIKSLSDEVMSSLTVKEGKYLVLYGNIPEIYVFKMLELDPIMVSTEASKYYHNIINEQQALFYSVLDYGYLIFQYLLEDMICNKLTGQFFSTDDEDKKFLLIHTNYLSDIIKESSHFF